MLILGYIGAILIGVVLGLMGGGGSILAVPVLAFLFGIEDSDLVTAYSLFIVGLTSCTGVVAYAREGLVSVKTSIVFAIPAIAGVYFTRLIIRPAIPEVLGTIGAFEITKGGATMLLFAVMMLLASVSMIRGRKDREDVPEQSFNYPLILVEGVIVGVLTGLIGAGGGFIIIPALVVLSKLPMKLAVGTSLVIISAKSLIGFIGDVQNMEMDWTLLLSVSALAMVGIVVGKKLSTKIDGKKLKPAFGWFVLVMGVFIMIKEFYK